MTLNTKCVICRILICYSRNKTMPPLSKTFQSQAHRPSQDQLSAKWPMIIADRISILGKSTISGLSQICYYSKCVSSWMGHGASISVELFSHTFGLPSVWPRRRVDNSRTLFAPFRRGVLRLGMSWWEIWHRHLASDLVQTKVQTTSACHTCSFFA